MSSPSIPDCPVCNGETELNGQGGISCFHCGYSSGRNMPPIQKKDLHIMEVLPTEINSEGKLVIKKP